MKRKDIYELAVVLAEVGTEVYPVKVAYAFARTQSKIKSEVEAIDAARKPPAEYQKYDEQRANLAKSHAVVDDSENPIVTEGRYTIANPRIFEEALDKLMAEYSDAIEEQENRVKEFIEFMEEDASIEVHAVDFEKLPDEFKPQHLRVLLDSKVVRPPKED